jgi:hypothetical protein
VTPIVVPAKAGTHTPCPIDRLLSMVPGSRSLRSLGRDERKDYSAKLVPQPQEALASGFFTLNEAPIRSSTKSISEPAM